MKLSEVIERLEGIEFNFADGDPEILIRISGVLARVDNIGYFQETDATNECVIIE